MDLHHRIFETASSAGTLIILHGLFGSSRNWNGVARQLSNTYRIIAVDMPNHGESSWLSHANYFKLAGAIEGFIEDRGLSGSTILGHSMGGKTAMVLAMKRPDLVSGLIVADIAPVSYDHQNLRYIDGMEAIELNLINNRSEADAQLAGYVEDPRLRGFLLINLVKKQGSYSWRINLKGLKEDLPALQGFPEMPEGSLYGGSVLFLDGEHSNYILPGHEKLIKAYFPHADIQRVEGASHWIHADRPTAVIEAVHDFMK